jgi:hypothetical protein
VACLLKAGIAEPEEMSVARQQLCKQVSKWTKSRDHCNHYTNATTEELL